MKNIEWEILQARKAVGRRIAKAMADKCMSQKELSALWNRPESQVSKLLNAETDLRLSTLVEIENILGIELIKK